MSQNELNENLEDFEEGTVTLSLDDGTEIECAIIAIFPCGDKDYIALLPLDDPDTDEVFLYRYNEDENGEPSLDDIEDDDEFERVSDAFDEILDSEEYDELVGEDELDD